MKLLLPLLILVSTVVFLIQNQQTVTLYFLGINAKTALFTLTLPVGIWVMLFSVFGILTSLIIQFINQFSSSFSSRDFTFPLQSSQLSGSSPSSKKTDWGKTSQRNWGKIEEDFEEEDGWDIEKPPRQPTFTREKLEQKLQEEEDRTTDFEVRQPPRKASRQGSIYSYTYRELGESKDSPLFQESVDPPPKKPEILESENKTVDQVYDANYRVLTPPYRKDKESSNFDQEEDQDWI
ncbi:MAG: LapA family protein [cyanobacterium endosymbiont of Rhopalodia musculus]|uniref:LapA family protein n=1 Tax=cyanobacterium endosymbiont of Epithemia clementina EcSB TaxID=3034674 RepID=UPI00247FF558|nr:LapA family protein [cyanobacterium endosymbiont of Epithemia clementina EcSB]WGT66743.1 LapA family protein [cyanobacterium endosymbiont of Epithemia clementina EcSB]